jgi:hypothetical protein
LDKVPFGPFRQKVLDTFFWGLFTMNHYETSTTVVGQGEIHLAGVPFTAGTEVEVAVSPKLPSEEQAPAQGDEALDAARERMRQLFDTIKGFRNTPRIPREELYERGSLR